MKTALEFRSLISAISAMTLCVLAGYAHADGGALTAEQIAERAVRPDALNWNGGRARVRMVLTDSEGKSRERGMEITGREKNGSYQSLVRFLTPADVAGTAFLLLEHGKDESEQYIYLPGIKRTRRIAGRERDSSFMGSDFTYADMQGVDSKQAKHVRRPDEKVGTESCYVVESTIDPALKLLYGKVVTWVRQSDFIALRTKFYDRTGKLEKTLYARRIRNVEGKLVVVEARMQNEQASHATDIFIDSVERREDLSDTQFTPSALEHL
jgi:hypothetical protein